MTTVSVQDDDFNTLVNWAEQYAQSRGWGSFSVAGELIEKIEKENSLTRYYLALRWKDRESNEYSPSQYQDEWPPTRTAVLSRYTSAWTYDEVMGAIRNTTPHPFSIEVTTDRSALVGWTDIDTYFGVP